MRFSRPRRDNLQLRTAPAPATSTTTTTSSRKSVGRVIRAKLKLFLHRGGSGSKVLPVAAQSSVVDEVLHKELHPSTEEEECTELELDSSQSSNKTPDCQPDGPFPASPRIVTVTITGSLVEVKPVATEELSGKKLGPSAQEEGESEERELIFQPSDNNAAGPPLNISFSASSPQISTATTTTTRVFAKLYPISEEEEKDQYEVGDEEISSEAHFVGLLSVSIGSIQQNFNGLEKLLRATKSTDNSESEKNIVVQAIVYGGKEGSAAEELRHCIQIFLSVRSTTMDGDASFSSSSSFFVDDEESGLFGNSDNDSNQGVLQSGLRIMSLQLVVNCLRLVLLSSRGVYPQSIKKKDAFWIRIICILVYYIETINPQDEDGIATLSWTLRCIRLLHSLRPAQTKQLLRQCLLPYIVNLKEYGEAHRVLVIEDEASRLLRRAKIG